MKNIVVITSSMRHKSNSTKLALSFKDGAESSGHSINFINLKDKNIKFCRGCLACVEKEECVFNDDSLEICKAIKNSDIVVFASPVFFYSISGILKTMLDKTNPLYQKEITFKDVYLLLSAGEKEKEAFEGAIKTIQGWIDCFEGVKLKKIICAGSCNKIDSIDDKFVREAYDLGKNI